MGIDSVVDKEESFDGFETAAPSLFEVGEKEAEGSEGISALVLVEGVTEEGVIVVIEEIGITGMGILTEEPDARRADGVGAGVVILLGLKFVLLVVEEGVTAFTGGITTAFVVVWLLGFVAEERIGRSETVTGFTVTDLVDSGLLNTGPTFEGPA